MQKEMSLEVKPISQNKDKLLPVADTFSPLVRLKNSSLSSFITYLSSLYLQLKPTGVPECPCLPGECT